MKIKLLTLIGCLLLTAGTYGAEIISLYTAGTGPNPDGNNTLVTSTTVGAGGGVFSLDTYVTFDGFTGRGLSYWLEVPSALAPYISITSETYFTWTDDNQPGGTTNFVSTVGANSGYLAENRDLGGTSLQDPDTGAFTQDKTAGTYHVSTLNFSIAAGAPAGTYTLLTTAGGTAGKDSEVSDTTDTRHAFDAQGAYTITVVPEPATLSLLGLSGLGSFGLTVLRARRKS